MATFIACLVFPLEKGILAGISINVLSILYHAARPKISIEFLMVSIGGMQRMKNLNFKDLNALSFHFIK